MRILLTGNLEQTARDYALNELVAAHLEEYLALKKKHIKILLRKRVKEEKSIRKVDGK